MASVTSGGRDEPLDQKEMKRWRMIHIAVLLASIVSISYGCVLLQRYTDGRYMWTQALTVFIILALTEAYQTYNLRRDAKNVKTNNC